MWNGGQPLPSSTSRPPAGLDRPTSLEGDDHRGLFLSVGSLAAAVALSAATSAVVHFVFQSQLLTIAVVAAGLIIGVAVELRRTRNVLTTRRTDTPRSPQPTVSRPPR
jgi:hypothetical protein